MDGQAEVDAAGLLIRNCHDVAHFFSSSKAAFSGEDSTLLCFDCLQVDAWWKAGQHSVSRLAFKAARHVLCRAARLGASRGCAFS